MAFPKVSPPIDLAQAAHSLVLEKAQYMLYTSLPHKQVYLSSVGTRAR